MASTAPHLEARQPGEQHPDLACLAMSLGREMAADALAERMQCDGVPIVDDQPRSQLQDGPAGVQSGLAPAPAGRVVCNRGRRMVTRSIQTLVEDIRLLSETNYEIVEAVRAIVKLGLQGCTEEVKYGGILFSSGLPICGVFAYRAHVSVEFGHGARINDPFGQLEGSGQGRRHLKLRSVEDIEHKHLTKYLPLAIQAARNA